MLAPLIESIVNCAWLYWVMLTQNAARFTFFNGAMRSLKSELIGSPPPPAEDDQELHDTPCIAPRFFKTVSIIQSKDSHAAPTINHLCLMFSEQDFRRGIWSHLLTIFIENTLELVAW